MAFSMLIARPSAQATSISASDRSVRACARGVGKVDQLWGCFTAHQLLEPLLRALAAVVWAQRPDEPVEIGVTLAEDRSPQVWASLARSLRGDPRHAKPRETLSADPRRSVRNQVTGA